MKEGEQNLLYYGDNLDILRRYVKDETVDLVYLDPPFNSNTNYNVLFAEKDGSKAASQIQAFSDTWTWTQESESVFGEIVTAGGKVSDCLQAFRIFLGECDMLAYLVMMSPRLMELRRTLKSTGSIYLHCDPAAGHYLKMLLDATFGPESFSSEIVWKRAGAHNMSRRWDAIHDLLLMYTKGTDHTWNQPFESYHDEYKARFKRQDPDGRRWQDVALTGGGASGSNTARSQMPWRGHVPPPGRNWSAPRIVTDFLGLTRDMDVLEKLEAMDKSGFVYWPKNGGTPRFKQYLEMLPGMPGGMCGRTYRQSTRKPPNASATPPKNRKPCLNGSSTRAAIPAMLCLTPSAAAGPRLPPFKRWAVRGSG